MNLIRPQRSAELRVTRSYHTVSDAAALVLAGTLPVDLFERGIIRYRLRFVTEPCELWPSKAAVKREERKSTIALWQARRQATEKASWTLCIIPALERWMGRTVLWVPLTFHMTQAFTAHVCFQCYLHRMARAASPRY